MLRILLRCVKCTSKKQSFYSTPQGQICWADNMSFIAKLSCPPDNLQRLCDLNGKQYSSISVIFQYLARVPLALLNVMSGLPVNLTVIA